MRLTDSAGAAGLAEGTAPQPAPRRGELLIRVRAAGLTATELLWYPTTHTKDGGTRSGAVPGHEFSGVIAAVGEGVAGAAAGQEVYGMNDWFADGAMAEYCVTLPSSVAPKPAHLSHAEAASVPIGALTAWQGLFDRANLKTGERVLVNGGAGSVGVYAVQLARHRGAHVIATASARNRDFVAELGAERVIDYRAERFEEIAKEMDVVFDTVGGETLARSWSVLGPRGRMVSIAAGENTTDERIKKAYFIVEPDRRQLTQIASLLDSGEVRPVVDAVIPLAAAPEAYRGKLSSRQGRGKVVVSIS